VERHGWVSGALLAGFPGEAGEVGQLGHAGGQALTVTGAEQIGDRGHLAAWAARYSARLVRRPVDDRMAARSMAVYRSGVFVAWFSIGTNHGHEPQ
jgi:hypothetical protein